MRGTKIQGFDGLNDKLMAQFSDDRKIGWRVKEDDAEDLLFSD